MTDPGEGLLPFFSEGGDGVNGVELRYLWAPTRAALP